MPTLPIPLLSGQQQGFDARVAPDGTILEIKELVTRKRGQWRKRNPYIEVTTSTLGSIPTLAGPIWNLGEFGRDRLIAYGQPPRLAFHEPDLDIITANSQLALPAFNAPQRYPVPHELGDGTADLTQTDTVYLNGWTIVMWVLGSVVTVGFYDSANTLVSVDDGIAIANGSCRLIPAGDYAVLIYPSDTDELTARVWNSASTGSAPGLGPFGVVATGVTANGLQGWGAAEQVGSGLFILAYETAVGPHVGSLELWDPTDNTAPVEQRTGIDLRSGSGLTKLAVNGTVGAGVILAYLAHTNVSVDPEIIYYHVADDLSGSLVGTSVAVAESAAFANTRAPSLLYLGANTWLLAVDYNNTISTAYDQGAIYSYTITAAGSVGSLNAHYDVRMASQLFGLDDGAGNIRPYIVAISDADAHASGGAIYTQNYYLLALTTASFSALPSYLRPQGFFGRDVAVRIASGNHVFPAVAYNTETSEWMWSGAMLAQGTALDRTRYSEDTRVGAALWRFESATRDRFKALTLGRAAYLSGGIMTRWNGGTLSEAGFLRRPDIARLTAGTTGSLTLLGQYSYLAVYESITNDGEVVRSEPSTPATITLTGSNDDITVVIRDNKLRADIATQEIPYTRIYLYRTIANQPGVYYMVHEQDDPIHGSAITAGGLISYVDTASDVAIGSRPIIYSTADGTPGLLPNCTPPPCRFHCLAGKRLVAGGTEIPEEVWFSAEKVEGEQVLWKNDAAFKVTLPAPCTAVGELDGYAVLFTATSVHMILGIGPDDTGNGAFEERRISTGLGAVTHHTLTLEQGLVYQSARGIEMIAKGFGSAIWVGEAVADVLGENLVTSITRVGEDVRFTFAEGVLNWNSTYNAWSWFELGALVAGATWGGAHVVGYESYSLPTAISLEAPGVTPSTYIPGQITLTDIRVGALLGYSRAHTLAVLFEWLGEATIVVEYSTDGGKTWSSEREYEMPSSRYALNQLATHQRQLRDQKSDRFRFRISDIALNGGTDGVVYLGLELDYINLRRGLRPIKRRSRG